MNYLVVLRDCTLCGAKDSAHTLACYDCQDRCHHRWRADTIPSKILVIICKRCGKRDTVSMLTEA